MISLPGTAAERVLFSLKPTPHVIGAALTLGIPELIGHDGASVSALANGAGISEGNMSRLLRALGDLGLVTRHGSDTVALSAAGRLLLPDVEDSLRDIVTLGTHPTAYAPWTHLVHSLRTGRPAFDEVFGASVFEYFAREPGLAALYNAAMGNFTRDIAAAVADSYDFGRHRRVIDIGGGDGTLLTTVLARYPGLVGTVFDTAVGAASAVPKVRAGDVADRCTVTVGNFFESVPAGADLYLMKWILHDWDDPAASVILGNCRRAMADDARLLIVEKVLPEPDSVSGPIDPDMSDLTMLVLYGGRERTRGEFDLLCATAGLTITDVLALPESYGACVLVTTCRSSEAALDALS